MTLRPSRPGRLSGSKIKGESFWEAQFDKHYFSLKGKNAENIVHELAQQSFFTDWCYPNPLLPNGQELCDLLVVFDNVAVIFQIKDLKLDKTGNLKESDLQKNLRQLNGARRSLFDLKIPLLLKNPRRGEERFDSSTVKEIFLISVIISEQQNQFSFVEVLKEHTVHVFTRDFTSLALSELDTIADFCDYLREKEQFLKDRKILITDSDERELLGTYLLLNRSFVSLDQIGAIVLDNGGWDYLRSQPEYLKYKEAEKISYFWDHIIEIAHTAGGCYEINAREMARTTRVERAFLSENFLEAQFKAHHEPPDYFFRRILGLNGVIYCFGFAETIDREERQSALADLCVVARAKSPMVGNVVGIATEKTMSSQKSYDFCFLDASEWTTEQQQDAKRISEEREFLKHPKWRHYEAGRS